MIISSWNIRGVNDPSKIGEVKSLIRNYKVSAIALMETRVKKNVGNIQKKICSNWKWVDNYAHSPKGRKWVCWDPAKVNLQVISVTVLCIYVSLKCLVMMS